MAITGKPLAATAGAMMFQKGGNAVDAAAAMLAATCTMWHAQLGRRDDRAHLRSAHEESDRHQRARRRPTGATAEYYKSKGMNYPPRFGPSPRSRRERPRYWMTMLRRIRNALAERRARAGDPEADGYPMEAQGDRPIESEKKRIMQWPYSRAGDASGISPAPAPRPRRSPSRRRRSVRRPRLRTMLRRRARSHPIPERPSRRDFRQPDLAATLRKLVDAEQLALKQGKSRREAIYAAYDRFYKGDIAQEIARGTQEQGGLITADDLAKWQVQSRRAGEGRATKASTSTSSPPGRRAR
jgi:gamma-glutamyltranspeptidase/glutathione hydrolase